MKLTRSRAIVALAVASGGAWAGAAQLRAVIFPPPIVSVSTITLRDPDSTAVAIRWTRKCVFTGGKTVCPTSVDVLAQTQTSSGFSWLQRRSRTNLTDTVRFLKPLCPDTVTFLGSVAAEASGVIERSNRTTARIAVRCRVRRASDVAEGVAFADSFPKANRRITFGRYWGIKIPATERAILLTEDLRAARSLADSTAARKKWADVTAGADSVYTPPRGDTLMALVGYQYPVCWVGKNRYTNAVVILDGDPLICEVVRTAFASERAS